MELRNGIEQARTSIERRVVVSVSDKVSAPLTKERGVESLGVRLRSLVILLSSSYGLEETKYQIEKRLINMHRPLEEKNKALQLISVVVVMGSAATTREMGTKSRLTFVR